MASIEFIQKRIEGKEKEIAKLQKKLERIQKAKDSNWEKNPYYYHESDLKYTQRDLDTAIKSLDGYKAQLATEEEKSASRNIQVILDFLEEWKVKSFDYYVEMFPKYLEAYGELQKIKDDYWNTWGEWRSDKRNEFPDMQSYRDARTNARYERDNKEALFRQTWGWIAPYVSSDGIREEALRKDLDREAERKYDFIIERTNAIVGQIVDASDLRIANNGELNGVVIGTKGNATIDTIGAGGYNIQRFHFRTLIKPWKSVV